MNICELYGWYALESNKVLVIMSDASKVSMNASYFNYTPETGELVLIDNQTKPFSKSELNYLPLAIMLVHPSVTFFISNPLLNRYSKGQGPIMCTM